MKKLSLLLVCVLVLASVATLFVSAADATYTAAYAETRPQVYGDGYTWDTAWEIGTWDSIGNAIATGHGAEAPKFKVLHDDTYLYICVVYKDTNGTIQQNGKNTKGEAVILGAETLAIAFIDANGNQQEFMFTGPYINKGDASMNVYVQVKGEWKENLTAVGDSEEGFRAKAVRGEDGTIHFEMRIPKAKLNLTGDSIKMEMSLYDSADGEQWGYENFAWANPAQKGFDVVKAGQNFGTLVLAAKGAAAEDTSAPTEDTSAPTEDTSAPTEDTSAPTENTTANEPAVDDNTETPATADAGLAIAAVVMAAAAMVVLSKKH